MDLIVVISSILIIKNLASLEFNLIYFEKNNPNKQAIQRIYELLPTFVSPKIAKPAPLKILLSTY